MPQPNRFYDRLIKNTGVNFAGYLITFLLNFFSLPYIIGKLGNNAYGVLAMTGAVVGYLAFLDVGMSNALIKSVSEFQAKGNIEKIRILLNTAIISNTFMGLLGGSILFFTAPALAVRALHVPADLTETTITVFRITAFTFALNMTSSAAGAIPTALQMFVLANIIKTVCGVLNAVATILVLCAGYSIIEISAILAILSFAIMLFNLWINSRLISGYQLLPEFDIKGFAELFRFGFFTLIHRLNSILLLQVDKFLIGLFLPIGNLTYYVAPATFSGYIMRLPQMVLQVMFPMISEIHAIHGGENEALKKLHIRASKYFVLYNLPLTIISIALAKPILEIWINPEMAAKGSEIMAILAAAYFIMSLAFVPSVILTGIGKPEVNAYISLFTGIMNLVLCLIFIPRMGAKGAAWSVLASSIATAPLFMFWVQHKFIRSGLREYMTESLGKPLLAGLVSGWGLFSAAKDRMGLFELIAFCAAFTTAFFIISLAVGAVDKEDRERFISFIRGISRKKR